MINRVILAGEVLRKVKEMTGKGTSITYLDVKTIKSFTNAAGIHKEVSHIHTVCGFGRMSDLINRLAKTGEFIFIEGELTKIPSYNSEMSSSCVMASSIQVLPESKRSGRNTTDPLPNHDDGESEGNC